MTTLQAEIIREYGPFPNVKNVGGVTFDGTHLWAAVGDRLLGIDPATGAPVKALDVPAHAGTAFDGRHLYQIAEKLIQKVDPHTGQVVSTIPVPGETNSGLAWAEGSLWVGQYRDRTIVQVDPATGKVLRTIRSDRFVTGVTWVDGELWHGTWENEESELRHLDPDTGDVLTSLQMPEGINVSGLESNGSDAFFVGGGGKGVVRVVRRPKRAAGAR
ncbi:MAG TPA: PQQ-binding-like beta-propeller repeat protein [Gemmatimonadaceae bacterium]|nr:PQQ-binding-like beta-propeller repeat protein [Gemmatimonadaceae bacterium]